MTATPPRADPAGTGTQYAGLTDMERAAASADFHMATCDAPVIADCNECQRRIDRIQAYLAAVLPEHRRMVLAGAADEVWAELRRIRLEARRAAAVSIEYINGWEDATGHLERLAAAAPPRGLSAPVPAGNTPAVPEEAGGRRATEGETEGKPPPDTSWLQTPEVRQGDERRRAAQVADQTEDGHG